MNYPLHNDAELLAYLKAKQAEIPFESTIIATTNGWFLVSDARYPQQIETQYDVTVDGAIAKILALIPTPAKRAEELRAKAAEMLAEANALAPLTTLAGDATSHA